MICSISHSMHQSWITRVEYWFRYVYTAHFEYDGCTLCIMCIPLHTSWRGVSPQTQIYTANSSSHRVRRIRECIKGGVDIKFKWRNFMNILYSLSYRLCNIWRWFFGRGWARCEYRCLWHWFSKCASGVFQKLREKT